MNKKEETMTDFNKWYEELQGVFTEICGDAPDHEDMECYRPYYDEGRSPREAFRTELEHCTYPE